MGKACAFMLGILLAGHGLLGIVSGEHILGHFNADPAIDFLFLLMGAVLLVVSARPVPGLAVRIALLAIAALLLILGWVADRDPEMYGLAPSHASLLDVFVYYVGAASCAAAACSPRIGDPIEA